MRRVLRLVITLAVLAAMGVGIVAVKRNATDVITPPAPLPDRAEVAALVDGSTFDVRSNDQLTRVRLLNVDTPVTGGPQHPGQCLGSEAAARLAQLIPAGTPVTLSYDKDRFGRTEATATTSDGKVVNAEMVRTGLAQAVTADSNERANAPILDAAHEAAAAKRGLHSADVPCTVAGQVKALTSQVATVPAGPPPTASAVDLATAADNATTVRYAAAELVSAFTQNRQDVAWLVLDPAERTDLSTRTRAAEDRAAAAETALRAAASATANQDATALAARTEVTLIATTLAKIRKAEADRAAAAASRLAAARKAQADAAAEEQARAQAAADADAKNKKDKQDKQKDDPSADDTPKDDSKKDDKPKKGDDTSGADSSGDDSTGDDGSHGSGHGGGGGGGGSGGGGGGGGGKKKN